MSDIKKYVGREDAPDPDRLDREAELGEWDEDLARRRAGETGLTLSEAHFRVLRFLRDHYLDHGGSRARELTEALEQAFEAEGGRKYLYELFPGGPVHQGCYIAGVPVPPDSADPAFGSVQ